MAIAIELAIALATLLVEDEDLVALYDGAYYFTNYLCALYSGSANGDSTVVVNKENLVELNSLSRLGGLDVVDEELLALLSLELLTVNLYDCVHFLLLCINGFFREAESGSCKHRRRASPIAFVSPSGL